MLILATAGFLASAFLTVMVARLFLGVPTKAESPLSWTEWMIVALIVFGPPILSIVCLKIIAESL